MIENALLKHAIHIGQSFDSALTVSGGNVLINGYLNYTSGNFNQSGGTITIDPNNAGATATSTTSSQYTLNITLIWIGIHILIPFQNLFLKASKLAESEIVVSEGFL